MLASVVEAIEGNTLVAARGGHVAVRGEISVFDLGCGARRRSPFITAVLVASPDGRQPLAPLEAYAHPCWLATDMLPLDSSHERRCLDILVRFQGWMTTQGCKVAVTKPLHDRSGYYLGQEAGDAVEVMGYDRPEYRAAKARMQAAITGKRIHYLKHLAHDPARMREHDRAFGLSLKQLGERAISKGQELPARPALPIPPILPPAITPIAPDRPGQPLPVPRILAQAAGTPALGAGVTALPSQPGPTRAADALLPVRPVTPLAAPSLGPASPRASTGYWTPGLTRPDPGPSASPVPKRS